MNGKCIIITSYLESENISSFVDINKGDYIICADGGAQHAFREGIAPHTIIGDFDSCPISDIEAVLASDVKYSNTNIIKTKPEKDDTDTVMCMKHGIKMGFGAFIIIGGLGGRIDHTIANIQCLSYLLDNGKSGMIADGKNQVKMIEGPDEIVLQPDSSCYFSIYSYTEQCTGVYEIDSKYLLDNATLTHSNPTGTSNEFLNKPAIIKVEKGKLLITKSPK